MAFTDLREGLEGRVQDGSFLDVCSFDVWVVRVGELMLDHGDKRGK